jgi:ParB-like chromosome segregation protein Spo0J
VNGVRLSFERTTVMIPVDQIIPTRKLADHLRRTSKYQSILASIREIGIIEALAVFPQTAPSSENQSRYLLLDGHLRLEVACSE